MYIPFWSEHKAIKKAKEELVDSLLELEKITEEHRISTWELVKAANGLKQGGDEQ